MRQLILRLRTCEAGAGLVEYAFLIAVVALALVGVLGVFRNVVGGFTNRTAVSVSTQSAAGYGGGGGPMVAPSERSGGHEPDASEPDSASGEPPSSPGEDHSVGAFRLKLR